MKRDKCLMLMDVVDLELLQSDESVLDSILSGVSDYNLDFVLGATLPHIQNNLSYNFKNIPCVSLALSDEFRAIGYDNIKNLKSNREFSRFESFEQRGLFILNSVKVDDEFSKKMLNAIMRNFCKMVEFEKKYLIN